MTVPDIDKWQTARLLIERHGDEAVEITEVRIRNLEAEGDPESAAIWREVLSAVKELQGRPQLLN